MLTKAYSVVQKSGCQVAKSSVPTQRAAARPAYKPSAHRYCTGVDPKTSLADSVASNGGVAKFPTSEFKHDEPTDRVNKIVEEVMSLSFIEAAQLSSAMAKRLGFPTAFSALTGGFGGGAAPAAAAPAAPAAPVAEAAPAKPAEPERPTRADVKIVKYADANKFKVLKEIRNLKPGMNLMESKALIEGLPKVVMEGLSYKDAEDWKKALTEAGAEVELV